MMLRRRFTQEISSDRIKRDPRVLTEQVQSTRNVFINHPPHRIVTPFEVSTTEIFKPY